MLLSVETTQRFCIKFLCSQCYNTINWLLHFFQPVTSKPQTSEQKISTETTFLSEKSKVSGIQTPSCHSRSDHQGAANTSFRLRKEHLE